MLQVASTFLKWKFSILNIYNFNVVSKNIFLINSLTFYQLFYIFFIKNQENLWENIILFFIYMMQCLQLLPS